MRQTGEILKKTRLEKGLSLEDVQKQTKIHLNILKAIEGDGLTDLSPVYLKAFVKIYAKALGLKPEELLPENKESLPAQQKAEPAEIRPPEVRLKTAKADGKLFKIAAIAAIAFLLLFGLIKLGRFVFSLRKAPAAAVKASPARPQAKAKPVSRNARKEAIPEGVRLTVIAKQNCMVTLRVDGKMFFQGVLTKGRSESWKAKEQMELSLSNAGGVELIVNSQHFTNIGKPKQKLNNILIDKEGLHIGR